MTTGSSGYCITIANTLKHMCVLFIAKVVETKKRHYGSTNIGRISTEIRQFEGSRNTCLQGAFHQKSHLSPICAIPRAAKCSKRQSQLVLKSCLPHYQTGMKLSNRTTCSFGRHMNQLNARTCVATSSCKCLIYLT